MRRRADALLDAAKHCQPKKPYTRPEPPKGASVLARLRRARVTVGQFGWLKRSGGAC